jgi:hypothetical protein
MTFSSLPFLLYETLEVGDTRDGGPSFAAYGTHSMARHRLSTWLFLYHDVDSISQIKKYYAGSGDNQYKILKSFWWIVYVGTIVSCRNARQLTSIF